MRSTAVHPVDSVSTTVITTTYTRKSLGFIPIDSPLRKCFIQLVTGSHFDTFILIMIILNSVAMASVDYRYIDENYEPASQNSWRNRTIEIAEVIFLVVFVLECVIKIVALGFVQGKDAYLKSVWNAFDFVIVIFR